MNPILLYQTQASGAEDNLWVTIVLILFSLSLISERIINFIKLQIPSYRDKALTVKGEKLREKRLMFLAIICGCFVALISQADLFYMLREGKLPGLGSNTETNTASLLNKSIGIVLTGLFISLGSKFWHDVLDIVLQISNLRKFRAEGAAKDVRTLSDEIVNTKREELAEKAKLLSPEFQSLKGYNGFRLATYDDGRTVVQVRFIDKVPPKSEWEWIGNKLGADFEILVGSKGVLYEN